MAVEKRSDVIFPMSYVVFPTSNIIFAMFGESFLFRICAFAGAHCIRPVSHSQERSFGP